MDFRTIVDVPRPDFAIGPQEKILCVGSCFADSIGRRFAEEKFRATVNPFGVMYNPASILHTVERTDCAPRVAFFTLGTNHVYILNETGEIVTTAASAPKGSSPSASSRWMSALDTCGRPSIRLPRETLRCRW